MPRQRVGLLNHTDRAAAARAVQAMLGTREIDIAALQRAFDGRRTGRMSMSYIDGVICAVPTADRAAYVDYARRCVAVFKAHGALSVVDAWGDDVPEGKLTSFPMAVKCEPHETVVFSWIEWPSKAVRDAAWKVVMDDPRLKPEHNPMPFDGRRMIYGGFQTLDTSDA